MTYPMTTPNPSISSDWLTVRTLRSLLRAELAAAERCRIAMENLHDQRFMTDLASCAGSHLARTQALALELARTGTPPPESAGFWGAVSALVQRVAISLSDWLGLVYLVHTEQRHRRRCRDALRKLKTHPYQLVQQHLLPEQRRIATAVRQAAAEVI